MSQNNLLVAPRAAPLVGDILYIIASFVPSIGDLCSLVLCSKRTYSAAIPVLYRTIHLIFHSAKTPNTKGKKPNNQKQILRQQRLFMQTILYRNNRLARYVRVLNWTIWLNNDRRANFDSAYMWQLFKKLDQVRILHLDFHTGKILLPPPDGLFPRATHMALTRHWPMHTAHKLLHSPARFTHLHIQYPDPISFRHRGTPPDRAGILAPITGKCTNLRHLTLRKICFVFRLTHILDEDEKIREEWMAILEAHKDTLQSVDLSFGRDNMDLSRWGSADYQDKRRTTLEGEVMPLLRGGGWKDLTSLVLEGVQLEEKKIDGLKCALPHADVVVLPGQWWSHNEESYQERFERSQMWGGRRQPWSDEAFRDPFNSEE
ncbi:hypothetical protein BOTBODRAFT_69447 [Botryobasidium botryosum FD-172 SS1]|uniref:F-box domain-containing protein n=1 Tax=Botryobasidium botryosum (strain FD-172 SS1) TaxID=930990 RepID=A0A067LZN8_BOTB1|nr:hypothetical protein BOTBODRAFT_69447 [Botryobasidium botryosum FD-172 SS1]